MIDKKTFFTVMLAIIATGIVINFIAAPVKAATGIDLKGGSFDGTTDL